MVHDVIHVIQDLAISRKEQEEKAMRGGGRDGPCDDDGARGYRASGCLHGVLLDFFLAAVGHFMLHGASHLVALREDVAHMAGTQQQVLRLDHEGL